MMPTKKEFYLILAGINFGMLFFSLFLNSPEMCFINILSIVALLIAYDIEDKNAR